MLQKLVSDERTRIAIRSAFLELATGATGAAGEGEVVSKPAPQTPPPTHAGGQDDGSYTNSLKLFILPRVFRGVFRESSTE